MRDIGDLFWKIVIRLLGVKKKMYSNAIQIEEDLYFVSIEKNGLDEVQQWMDIGGHMEEPRKAWDCMNWMEKLDDKDVLKEVEYAAIKNENLQLLLLVKTYQAVHDGLKHYATHELFEELKSRKGVKLVWTTPEHSTVTVAENSPTPVLIITD